MKKVVGGVMVFVCGAAMAGLEADFGTETGRIRPELGQLAAAGRKRL